MAGTDPFRPTLVITAHLQPASTCDVCDWTTQGRTATAEAKGHVRETGHRVFVDAVTRAVYQGIERPTPKVSS